MEGSSTWNRSFLRKAMWCAAGGVLLLPAIAMQLGAEGVVWTAQDFVAMGVMLALAGAAFEVFARMSGGVIYRLGAAAAVGGALLLVWVNLAVGFIGDEGNPANLLFGGVLLVEIAGAIVVRARASGMAFVMLATACAQALVGGFALAGKLGEAWEIVMGTTLFVAIWLGSAAMFRLASRGRAHG
ncbi:hypothetical protein LK996_12050 [Lysobacter sp. A6]|uniref:DUF308 domain-containing protein n=1 Tax=Noviluteimonas lactosilytica TaxID=2888523 RepID=A0ABS8JJL3_9GAMM|nr:hypothetical protein [Lysobacter lactosilyticus]MCC8363805.1 hypothetical protein [Lysobacter lactosilyticus]